MQSAARNDSETASPTSHMRTELTTDLLAEASRDQCYLHSGRQTLGDHAHAGAHAVRRPPTVCLASRCNAYMYGIRYTSVSVRHRLPRAVVMGQTPKLDRLGFYRATDTAMRVVRRHRASVGRCVNNTALYSPQLASSLLLTGVLRLLVHVCVTRCQHIYASVIVSDNLNGCPRLICLVLETAALCDIFVRSAV